MVLQQGSINLLVREAGGQIPNRCVTFCQCPAGGWCRGVKHHVKFLQGVAVPHQRGCGEDFSEVYSFLSRSCCRTHAEKSAVRC